jgi:hypothetical protein
LDIYNELVLQEPIVFQGIKVYQPIIRDIFEYGIEKYNNFLIPYSIIYDMLGIPEGYEDKVKMFDAVLSDGQLFSLLYLSLRYFCKTEDITLYKNTIIIGTNILYRDNFDEFSDIILKIHAREKPKVDKLPDNPRQREIELKLREAKARCKPKNGFQLCDIINNVRYGGKYYISLDEIKQMTLWSLSNAFNAKIGLSNYDANFSIALVAGDKDNTLENNHWTKLLKVEK